MAAAEDAHMYGRAADEGRRGDLKEKVGWRQIDCSLACLLRVNKQNDTRLQDCRADMTYCAAAGDDVHEQ